jgi:hypothetical protein
MVDIATGWSERVAILGRSGRAVGAGLDRALQRLPFQIKQSHPDNGGESYDDHLIRYFGEEIVGMRLSRSRPYHKNDNRMVEQKNDTLIRQYTGHGRLDTREQCYHLNEIYELMWTYYNLFQPVLHLVQKGYEDGKLKRKWDEAKTTYQRLKQTQVLSKETEARLDKLYQETNPRELRQQIYKLLSRLWDTSTSQERVA